MSAKKNRTEYLRRFLSIFVDTKYVLLLYVVEVSQKDFRESAFSRDACVFILVLDVLWISCVYRVPLYEVFNGQLEL